MCTTDNERSRSVCFTGHRTISESELARVIPTLDSVISELISDGHRIFYAGGALGFDTVAAFRVLAAREKDPSVKLILALPCRDQTKNWTNLRSINEYRILKDNADSVIYIKDFYDRSCMMERNIYMVDHSAVCVAYFSGKSGGTANTVRYAEKSGIPVINLFCNL